MPAPKNFSAGGIATPADAALADAVGSTSGMLKAARELEADTFIVATDKGLLHQMRRQNPGKTFLEAPTAGESAISSAEPRRTRVRTRASLREDLLETRRIGTLLGLGNSAGLQPPYLGDRLPRGFARRQIGRNIQRKLWQH